MGKNISDAVREVCLWLPQTEEVLSHGSPDFRIIGGKTFATYVINHHGDGHLALWLRAPQGAQSMYVDADPEHFYVPPYVGPKGWLGVDLDKGLDWQQIASLVREAYVEVAPTSLSATLGPTPEIIAPVETIDPEVFDPFSGAWAQSQLRQIETLCLAYPETHRDTQFGNPCFKAGKKNFATLYFSDKKLYLSVWAGADEQASRSLDPRYVIPAYTGRNGWLSLDLKTPPMSGEIEDLLDGSFRHFALKRMLKALDET